MTREELKRHIREAIKTEESAITIYAGHLSSIVTRSGLSNSGTSRIKSILDTLIKANRAHRNLLNILLKRIQEESIDVY